MKRYLRQMILPQIGEAGQLALGNSKVLIVGAGGLGLPVSQALVAAGVGHITVLDDDSVELSNLQRQTLYTEKDIGRPKTVALTEKLKMQNSDVSICGVNERLRSNNARKYVAAHDVIIDGSDNFATKFLINDACLLEKKLWVYGSVSRFEGQLAVFGDEQGSCYRCLYEKAPKTKIENCAEQGVLGAVTGVVGNYQALEGLKCLIHLLGRGADFAPQFGTLRVFDFLSYDHRTLFIPKKVTCICSQPKLIELKDELETCEFNFKKTWNDFKQDVNDKILFDVRSTEEFQLGHHTEGKLWRDQPVEWLKTKSAQTKIYLYCQSGKRAREKCLNLRGRGFHVFYIGDSYHS